MPLQWVIQTDGAACWLATQQDAKMSDPLLIILFGLPGAGKSFVGEMLRDEFGFTFHEADDDIPDDYRQLVVAGHVVGEPMRDDYHRNLLDVIAALWAVHARLAVAAPLLRDRHRRWLHERFPQALFLYVESEPAAWQARLSRRTHTISLDYARKVAGLNEPISVPFERLENNAEGMEAVRAQLTRLLGQASN